MPDDIFEPHHDKEEKGTDAQSTHHHQSAWMAHWMHTNFKSATHPSNHLSIDFKSKRENKEDSGSDEHDLLGEPGIGRDISTDPEPEPFKEVTEATPVAFLNESLIPEKSKGGSLDFKSSPIFNLSQKREGMLSLKREQYAIYHGEVLKSHTDDSSEGLSFNRHWSLLPSTSARMPPNTAALSSDCHLLPEGVLPTELLMKSHYPVEKKNLWNDFVKSTSDAVPCGHNKENTSVPSCTCGQRKIHQSSYNLASMGHFTSTDYSYSLFIHEKKMSSLVDPHRYGLSKLMQSGPAPLAKGPLAASDDLVGDQSQKMQNYSGTARFSSHCSHCESTQRENCYHGSTSASQLPYSVHEMETMKICTTVDSVDESSRDHPKISQTTRHFLISKNADVNLSDRDKHFRESITPTKFKGNALNEIPNFSPPINYHAPEGVKLKALGSSMESEEKENAQDLETPASLRNESSAETDTMDINALREDYLSGDVPMLSNKCPKDSQNSPTPPVAMASSGREKNNEKSVNIALPDINQEPVALPAVASPEDERETSTSRTQSLDVEHFLSNVEENANSKSSSCGNGTFGTEPSSRWVKRLQFSIPDSYGMKSAKIGESSSPDKVNKIFSQIMKGNKTNPEPKMICHAEQQMAENSPETTSANSKSSLLKAKKTVETTLSHPWIQRWRKTNTSSTQKRLETVEILEPQSSNRMLEDLEKKQFPSIAAMALMGKAIRSFYPCEFMKKGPLIVWNTKRL